MKSSLPPLKSLQFFLAAARAQSFKGAAETLFVSQAAVSQQIRLLEQRLDVQLFIRSKQNTYLTDAGRLLLPFIERGFDELHSGVQSIVGDPNPHILRISTLHSFASSWLLPRIQEFQLQQPDLMLQLAPTNELVSFDNSGIDLAIRMGRGGYAPLEEKEVLHDRMIFIASKKLVDNINVYDAKQVFKLPWIEDTSKGIQDCLTIACKHFDIDRGSLNPIMTAANAVPLIESVVEGRGFTLMSSSLVTEHLRNGRVVKLLDYSIDSPYSLYLVAPSQHFTWQKVRKFEQWFIPKLASSFADLAKW